MKPRMPGKSLFANVVLFLAASLLTILLLEGIARVVLRRDFGQGLLIGDPLLELTPRGPRLRPDQRLDWPSPLSRRTVRLKTNAQGFRGPAIAPEKSRPRLLVLGDSIAFGAGVEDRDTWPRQLEQSLAGRVEVINAGIPDLGTQEELNLLREEGPRLKPDLVLVAYYLNDSLPPYSFSQEYGAMSPTRAGWITRMRQTSYLFRWLWERYLVTHYVKSSGRGTGPWVRLFQQGDWRHTPAAFQELVQKADSDFGAAWTPAGWQALPSQLQQIQDWAVRHQARITVVAFPVSIQVEAEFLDDFPQQKLGQICLELGIPYLDLLPALRPRAEQELFFDQCHLTPAGAAATAQAIARFLVGQGLLP